VTETLRERVRELSDANAFLEAFAEFAAHDLSTPLCQVLSYADLLKASLGPALSGEARNFYEALLTAAERGRTIVDALRGLARLRTDSVSFVRVDAAALMRSALGEISDTLWETRAQVEVAPLPALYGDGALLQRLFVNLLENAVKFRKRGTPARVRVSSRRREDGWVEVSVSDDGVGFAQAEAERIFQPFVRLAAGGNSEEAGTGMGLALCARIVERHGGTIAAQSRPGEGATIVVALPAATG